MRSLSEALGTLTFAVFAGVFVACAPTQTASTTTTAADLPSPSRSDAPSTREAADADGPEGQLACKSRSMAEGKAELYLDWNGSSARGTLRREAPSGMVSVQNIRAERYKGMVIADDTLSTDSSSTRPRSGSTTARSTSASATTNRPGSPANRPSVTHRGIGSTASRP